MAKEGVAELVAQQTWLDPVSDVVQKTIERIYASSGPAGQRVKNVLSGTWLGHPVHPMITDVPVGSWTTSFIFDALDAATGRKEFATAADATLSIGLTAAAAAAVTGLSDWHFTIDRPRRIGMMHGLLNVGAVGLYGASLACRLSGSRAWGRGLAFVAYGVAGISAWLGGDLAFDEHVGVNHAPLEEEQPSDYTAVLDDAALQEGLPQRVDANGLAVMLVRQRGQIYCLAESCSHLGGPLSEGQITDGVVTCPWHASQFKLADGQVVNGPATYPQPCFQTRVRDGKIEIGPPRIETVAPVADVTEPIRQGLKALGGAITGAAS